MSQKSLKRELYECLQTAKCPVHYSDADFKGYPLIIYHQLYTRAYYASGKRHSRRYYYQVDYYTDAYVDLSDTNPLEELRATLVANGFRCGEWVEEHTRATDLEAVDIHYYIEVSAYECY